jgi:hypothetical protein
VLDEAALGQEGAHHEALGDPARGQEPERGSEQRGRGDRAGQDDRQQQDPSTTLAHRPGLRPQQPPLQPRDGATDDDDRVGQAAVEPSGLARDRVGEHGDEQGGQGGARRVEEHPALTPR